MQAFRIHFCNKRILHLDPELTLYGTQLEWLMKPNFFDILVNACKGIICYTSNSVNLDHILLFDKKMTLQRILTKSSPRKPEQIPCKLNLNVSQNSEKHKTDKYYISHSGKGLIVRRGQTFDITFDFSVKFDTEKDVLKLNFSAGKIKSSSKEIKTVVLSTKENDTEPWAAWILENDDKLKIRIRTPPSCSVGIWNLEIEKAMKFENSTLKFSDGIQIYILFNPWCKEDLVHIPVTHEDNFLDEYILEDVGTIFVGTYDKFEGKPWNFGQFDKNILDCAMYLLDTHLLSWTDRGNPTTVSRKISEFVTTANGTGVLEPKWGHYERGERHPSTWTGSVAILNEYYTTKKPVLYGQCWVFSGITTTLCRTLGIPARSVTNYKSFHCLKGAISNNLYYRKDTNNHVDCDNCESWNFHVWNDVWMARQSYLNSGWQAIDATPQEKSQGIYRCGPAPLHAIKNGEVAMEHDTAFVFGEVNAQLVHWKPSETEFQKLEISKVDKVVVGRKILTKQPDHKSQEKEKYVDIIKEYKYIEGSNEYTAVLNALQKNTGWQYAHTVKEMAKDIEFKMVEKKEVMIGEEFKITLKIKNQSTSKKRIVGCISISSMFYHGIEAENVQKKEIEEELYSNKDKEIILNVTYIDYAKKVVDQYHMLVTCICRIKETKQVFAHYDTFRMSKPTLNIKVQSKKKTILIPTQLPVNVDVTFDNPLPVKLTGCKLTAVGPGLTHKTVIHLHKHGEVEAKTTFKATLRLHLQKTSKSEVIVQFNSNELKVIEGSCIIDTE